MLYSFPSNGPGDIDAFDSRIASKPYCSTTAINAYRTVIRPMSIRSHYDSVGREGVYE